MLASSSALARSPAASGSSCSGSPTSAHAPGPRLDAPDDQSAAGRHQDGRPEAGPDAGHKRRKQKNPRKQTGDSCSSSASSSDELGAAGLDAQGE